ncbi:MAG: TonB-dependent receptor, partial [Pseudomonadales bacterium]
VTATRREESIQDIPIAVSAFVGEDLISRGVQDLYGLQEVSPSVSVYSSNSTSNGGTLRIRGVGTTGNNPGLEAAVGTFIDGVYRSRAGQAFSDLIDIERVEILRGPQGTLFGKNTSAGALQILTKAPEFETSGSASFTAGDFGLLKAHLISTGAITDKLAYRLSLQGHERDGYYEDDFNGDEAYDRRDRYTFKGQLLFAPSDNFESRLIYDYTEKKEDCCPANFEYFNDTTQGPSATTRGVLSSGHAPGAIVNDLLEAQGRPTEDANFPSDDYEVGVNFKPFEETEDWGIQNQASWQVNDRMELVSITAYREFEVSRGQDIDFSGADLLQPQYTAEKFENFSQELQLTWSTENSDWLIGAYFYTEDIASDESIRIGSQGPVYLSRYIVGLADPTASLLSANETATWGTTIGATPIG